MNRVFRRIAAVLVASVVASFAVTDAAHAANPTTDLMWFDRHTGEVSTWQLNGSGNVLGTQSLSWRCSYASGCSSAWSAIGNGDVDNDGNQDLMWFNATNGEVSSWLTDGSGTVWGTQAVDWRCDSASGCSAQWEPVTLGDFNSDGNQDLLWWNSTSGVLSAWLLNGSGNVLTRQDLDWRCHWASYCAYYWKPVGAGDMDNDGRVDLVWFNHQDGVVSSWLLNGYGNVLTRQDVDWRCGSGCSLRWHPVGIGDLDGNGRQDVTWYHSSTGLVSSWLLNGYGNVLAQQDLDRRCAYPDCASQWKIVDLVR